MTQTLLTQSLKRVSPSVALVVALAVLTGCAVGPNYKRPAVDVPGMHRGSTTDTPVSADLKPQPGQPEQAKADEAPDQLGSTRADQLPSLSAGGNVASQQSPQIGPIPAYEVTQGQLTASAAYNLDFWGKYRRATEAARATLLADEWAQKEVTATLVANLATAYFQLRELDLELEISRRTFHSRSDSLQLTQTLEQHGIDSLLDVRQSEQLVYTAATEIPDFERQIAQQENAISILLGNNPGDVPRGLRLTEEPHAPEVPAGLPSSLLERRPDVREAEENL